MECLRSFNFSLVNQSNYNAAVGLKTWTIGLQNFWLIERIFATGSKYNIQGFKNVNIFKIEITGDFYSSALPVGVSALVNNWSWIITIKGQNSSAVGQVVAAPNPLGMLEAPNDPSFILSKYQSFVNFESPIQSAKEIEVYKFYVEGIADESLLNVQMGYVLNVTVFYKYEGE